MCAALIGWQKCDGVRPVCGCCERGRRPGQCDFDPPEGRAYRLQQRIRELEETIHAIESQSRRRRARTGSSSPGSSAPPSAPTGAMTFVPSSSLLSYGAEYAQPQPQLIAPHQLPASVDWFAPSMELDPSGLHASYNGQSYPHASSESPPLPVRLRPLLAQPVLMLVFCGMIIAYAPTTGPFRQGRSGTEWLFNDAVQGFTGPVDTDPFTAIAHLAIMPVSTLLDPVSVSLLSSPMHDYLCVRFGVHVVSAHRFPQDCIIHGAPTRVRPSS